MASVSILLNSNVLNIQSELNLKGKKFAEIKVSATKYIYHR